MTDGIEPISVQERKERIAKAQQLMNAHKLDAIFMEGTASCYYYTGIEWWQSERTFGVLIPAKGTIAYVCPKFEEDRARELILPEFGNEVRCWEEHENPFELYCRFTSGWRWDTQAHWVGRTRSLLYIRWHT